MKQRSTFLRIFSFMKGHLKLYIFSVVFVGLFSLMVQLLLATLFKEMFNAIANNDLKQMIESVKFYAIFIISNFFIVPIFIYIINKIVAITTGNIRKAVFDKLEKLPLSYFKNNHSGDIVSRMTNDIAETERVYDTIFFNIVMSIITAFGALIYTFILDWRMGVATVGCGVLILFINLYYAKILRVLSKTIQERLAKLNEILTNLLDGVQIIRVFNLQKMIMNKFGKQNDEVCSSSMKRVKTQAVVSSLNTISGFLSFGGLASLGCYLAIEGYITVGVIVAVIQLQNSINNLSRMLGTFITSMQASLAASDRVFEVLDEDEEPVLYELESVNQISDDMIKMENLTFQYDDDNTKVLDNLSFNIPKGKVYALVGPSGGGKSTVFKLILNYYKPIKGDLHIDRHSISKQKIKDIRDKIAYVPQDAYLFTGTIEDNIRHGKKDATKEEIVQAAKKANAHDFIMEMKEGYDTKVGERGTELSGGQRQRIAIARAIIKNAPILLLDEATSSLDTESEHLVQEALNQLMKNKTTLIVAHRLQTIQNADQILVLKDGHIVEQGSHDTLLSQDSVYKNLYNKQFKLALGES